MITKIHIEKRISNKIDKEKLQKTNKLFNDNKFNSSYKIGRLSSIINQKDFLNEEEWIKYYFDTGKNRKNNYDYGRTLEEFEIIVKEYFDVISKNLSEEEITYEDARKQLFQRIFYDTWDGIMNELKTISNLKKKFPTYDFLKTSGIVDTQYAIDIEVKENNKLIAGIQLKPISYIKNQELDYIKNSHSLNEEKNLEYIKKYDVPIFYLYYKPNKSIVENNDYNLLNYLLSGVFDLCKKSLSTYIKNKDKEYILFRNSYLYQFKYNVMFEAKKNHRVKFAFVFKDSYSMYNLAKYQLTYNVPIFEVEYINNQIVFKKLQIII